MFGLNTPWLTVKQITLKNQWGNLTTIDIIWERITGLIDLWHEASAGFFTDDGDCQVKYACDFVDFLIERNVPISPPGGKSFTRNQDYYKIS